jgi:hypothetical protein
MAVTNNVKLAVAAKAATVSGVNQVVMTRMNPAQMTLPAIVVENAGGLGGSATKLTLGNKGRRRQHFTLALWVRHNEPDETVTGILDGLANAIETPGAISATGAHVLYCDLASWTEVATPEGQRNQYAVCVAGVEVAYTYTRGGL